jgi:hypothetical protein
MCKWDGNIKMNHKEAGWVDKEWIFWARLEPL